MYRAVGERQAEASQRRWSDRLAGAQAVEVEVLDHGCVGVGAEVDDDLALGVVGVDVVEGEAGIGPKAGGGLAGGAIDEREAGSELGLPAVILDVGAPGQRQSQRVDDVGELGEYEVALGQPEGVHVGGLA